MYNDLVNFGDIGGLSDSRGLILQQGVFYRGGLYGNVGLVSRRILEDVGIDTVFNYTGVKDKDFSFVGGKVYHTPASEHLDLTQSLNGVYDGSIKADTDELMVKFYSELGFDNEAYRNMVNHVRTLPTKPMLQSCTAGKDRTGVGVSILLMVLGFDIDVIIQEYMTTEEAIEELYIQDRELMFKLHGDNERSREILELRFRNEMRAKEIYINSFLGSVINAYGSFDAYLFHEYGLEKEELDSIRNFYLR